MKFHRHHKEPIMAADMTPMIDMVFLLIAFFTVVVNFAETEQNERVRLPASELAMPRETPPEHPIMLQVTRQGSIVYGGVEYQPNTLKDALEREKTYINLLPQGDFRKATIIIRAHDSCPGAKFKLVRDACKEVGFENFALRAKSERSKFFENRSGG